MIFLCLLMIFSIDQIDTAHFNGGTITWFPVYPDSNSSSVLITVTQSYSWVYTSVPCANNIGTVTDTLSCVANCSTNANNTAKAISIQTDCTSYSVSLNTTFSARSVNVSVPVNTYFWIAYVGSAWRTLENSVSTGSGWSGGAGWSIVSLIDLRRRPDGLINTPPTSQVTSPQNVLVNKTTAILIPVSDVNTNDDLRCRLSQNKRYSIR